MCSSDLSYSDYSNDYAFNQHAYTHNIQMNLTQNDHDIKMIGERLHDNVDSIKMIVKHFSMMGTK